MQLDACNEEAHHQRAVTRDNQNLCRSRFQFCKQKIKKIRIYRYFIDLTGVKLINIKFNTMGNKVYIVDFFFIFSFLYTQCL